MKKYALYNPNKQVAKLIGSKQIIDVSIGANVIVEHNLSDLDKPDFDFYKSNHVIEIDIKENKISNVTFVDSSMEHLPIGKNISDRTTEIGECLKDVTNMSTAVILRAVDAYTNTFKTNDYVIVSDTIPKPKDIQEAKLAILDEADAVSKVAKNLLWTSQHGQSMAASYSRDQHVIMALVRAKDIHKATNNGEWFYTGNIKEGKVLFSFDEFGNLQDKEPKSNSLEMS